MPRPTYSTTNTATTMLSATSCASDFASTTYNSTALTTPDLSSPTKGQYGKLEPMLQVFEGGNQHHHHYQPENEESSPTRTRSRSPTVMESDRYPTTPRRRSLELARGTSVKDRAKEFEASTTSSASRTPRPLPSPMQVRTAASSTTTPLRINKAYSMAASTTLVAASTSTSAPKTTPRKRVPVPSSATIYQHERNTQSLDVGSPSRSASKVSAKKMIQQWENLPATPTTARISSPIGQRVLSRDYLNEKPLPIPSASAVAASAPYTPSKSVSTAYQSSPARNTFAPSPLNQYHLQTPDAGPSRKRNSVSPSTSAYSLSPSGEKRRKGKSPLKDMLNVFGGGIQAIGRKAREKGKGMSRYGSKDSLAPSKGPSSLWSDPIDRVGSNGLPGGIVYSDRMGDKEMMRRQSDPTVLRGSAIVYLIPTPCSSVSSWGSWLTSWAILTPSQLKITYCPVFQDPQTGHSTPKRILSGTGPNQTTSGPAVAFTSIPPPELGSMPDVELDMAQCVEVRSVRKDEVRGRGIPPVPEGVGTEVLELSWQDGTKRYIGVEGVGGRLGWISAIWDALLASKPEAMRDLPPPSPLLRPTQEISPRSRYSPPKASTEPENDFKPTLQLQTRSQNENGRSELQQRVAAYESKTAVSSAPPVQKFGDTWVAASVIGRGSGSDAELRPLPGGDVLRDSVQRMFDKGPDSRTTSTSDSGPSRSDSEATARIKAWQPTTERDLSIFSRSGSKRSQNSNYSYSTDSPTVSDHDQPGPSDILMGYTQPDTVLSFDMNDLNPSRSASQVRRTSTILGGDEGTIKRRGGNLTVVEEGSDDGMTEAMRAATHISHVTFPKPTIGAGTGTPRLNFSNRNGHGTLTPIPSVSHSTTESEETATMVTPKTAQSTVTTHTLDESVLDKLESHTSEHGQISKKVDGVQTELQAAIASLSTILAHSKILSDPLRAPVPKALDDRLSSLGLDLKGIENSIQLSNLPKSRESIIDESQLPEIHSKLDTIAKACEAILARNAEANIASSIKQEPSTATTAKRPPRPAKKGSLNLTTDPDDEKMAGEEVSQIMAQLTGGSSKSKASPRLGGLQVLHNASAPNSPKPSTPDAVTQQVGEVLGLVKEIKEGRVMQTQQTTDIARYLNELNSWLEKFVQNSSKDITEMSTRLKTLAGEPATEDRASVPGLPDLVADVHSMMSEQKRLNDEEGRMGQRVDNLLQMMGEERERMAGQQSTIDHVLGVIENHRQANESVLRSLAIDLTNEIRGERIRFVEAMQQATTVNVNFHIEEFKKVLATEVGKAMSELGNVKAEKQALEQQISDLFALKAKHAPGSSRKNTRNRGPIPPQAGPSSQVGMAQPSPGVHNRMLPNPPR